MDYFTKANKKVQKTALALGLRRSEAFCFDLPAGWTCPQARDCLAKADRHTGTIKNGKEWQFQCFAANFERQYPSVRNKRWDNFDSVRDALSIGPSYLAAMLDNDLPHGAKLVRIHASGDFFSRAYFEAWVILAAMRPDCRFYAYTKSVDLVQGYDFPPNLAITASLGGRQDGLVRIQSAKVVASEEMAQHLGLPVDNDDMHAAMPSGDFALVVHGVQPKGGHRIAE